MLQWNSKKQKSETPVSNPMIKTRLALRLVDDVVHIHDSFHDLEWETTMNYAVMLLACGVQGSEDTRMIEIGENIFQECDLRVFDGWFPMDQLIFQVLGMEYEVYADQKARSSTQIRPDFFFSIEHAMQIPTMEEVNPRPGDFVSYRDEEGVQKAMKYVKPCNPKTDNKRKFVAVAAFVMLALMTVMSLLHTKDRQQLQASGPKELSMHGKS